MALLAHAVLVGSDRSPLEDDGQVGIQRAVEDRGNGLREAVPDPDPHDDGDDHHQGQTACPGLSEERDPEPGHKGQGAADLQETDESALGGKSISLELTVEMPGGEASRSVNQERQGREQGDGLLQVPDNREGRLRLQRHSPQKAAEC